MRVRSLGLLFAILISAAGEGGEVTVPSSLDGVPQPAILDIPSAAGARPLLVHVHSWSSDYTSSSGFKELRAECERRGWVFLSPDFRGPNKRPEACGSDIAVQDVLDAVLYAMRQASVDPARIYLTGGSGGGHMSLHLAHRAPGLWAAVSSFVPITDLAAWHQFSKEKGHRYAGMLEQCCGGPPGSWQPDAEYRRRSPLFHLSSAKGVPIDIQAGIQDGHTGSVPVRHSLLAFNMLAEANGYAARKLTNSDIEFITREAKIPDHLSAEREKENGRKHAILFRRAAGPARVTIFHGGHESDFDAALLFLEKHRKAKRGALVVLSGLEDDRVLQRDGASAEARLSGVASVAGSMETRLGSSAWKPLAAIAAGAWSATLRIPSGGPHLVEIRLVGRDGVEAGVARFERILAGDLWVLAGQSNMVGRALIESEDSPHSQVHMLRREGGWAVARQPLHEARRPGYGYGLGIAFAREMVRRTRVPIGLIPTAVGGTSLAQWDPALKNQGRASLYGAMLSRFHVAGGRVAGVLWYQGESDTMKEEASTTYGDRFRRFVETVRSDFSQPEVPFYFAQLSRYALEGRDLQGWNRVQEAQRQSEGSIPKSGMVATVDLELGDPIHLDQPSLSRLGARFARRVLDGNGPHFVEARWDGRQRIRVVVGGLGKNDPAKLGRILGFELTTPSGEPHAAIYRARLDPANSEVVLDLGDSKGPSDLHLWYGRGLNPACTVRDEQDRALPAFGPIVLPPRPPE